MQLIINEPVNNWRSRYCFVRQFLQSPRPSLTQRPTRLFGAFLSAAEQLPEAAGLECIDVFIALTNPKDSFVCARVSPSDTVCTAE
jgi:hypothetical protein